MLEKLESRKFILFVVILVILTSFVVLGKMEVDQFIGWLSANYALYILGNSMDNVTKK